MRLRHSRGFSLLEMAIVMLIAGLIIAGIWILAAQINHENKKAILGRDVIQIVVNTRALFVNQTTSTGNFTSADAITANIFPASWVQGNPAVPILRQPFATDFVSPSAIIQNSPIDAEDIYLIVGVTNSRERALPVDACVSLALKLGQAENFDRFGFKIIYIANGTSTRTFNRNSVPITPAAAASGCSTADTNSVQVIFSPN